MNRLFRSLGPMLAVVGPGLITSTVDNDASGIATYSIAGAQFGYGLLWTLIPITLLLIVIQEMVARMGIVSGKGLADLIREQYGVKVTFLVMMGLLFANLTTTIAEFAGIVAAGDIAGISRFILVPGCIGVIMFFVLKANYRTIEKVFLVLILFYAAYAASAFMARPDWGAVAVATAVPAITWSSQYWIVLVAVVGTSVTPWMQFYLQSSVIEKGIKPEQLNITRIDVIVGSIVTSLVALCIIVATGATLFNQDIQLHDAKDVAIALEPFAGKFASSLFALGLFMAAFLGAWLVPISTAYFIAEGVGFESGVNKTFSEAPQFYMLLFFMLALGGAFMLIPGIPLIQVFIFAQVVNALLLPIVFGFVIVLASNKEIMRDHVSPRWLTALAYGILGVLVIMSGVLIAMPLLGQ